MSRPNLHVGDRVKLREGETISKYTEGLELDRIYTVEEFRSVGYIFLRGVRNNHLQGSYNIDRFDKVDKISNEQRIQQRKEQAYAKV